MKRALINEKRRVVRTSDGKLKQAPEAFELTNEQSARVEASNEPLFLVEGSLLTLRAKLWATNPEAVKESLRPERNRLLAESDWTQLNDSPLSEDKLAAWAAYRQDLRDLPDNIDENGEVEFPVAP